MAKFMKTKWVLLLLAVLGFIVVNWRLPFLRFTNHWANTAVGQLELLFVLVLIVVALGRLNQWASQWRAFPFQLGLVLMSVSVMGMAVVRSCSFPPHDNEADTYFNKIAQIDAHLAVYRVTGGGGATEASGIEVRREQVLLPGVLLVQTVFSQYGLSEIAYTKTDRGVLLHSPSSPAVLCVVAPKKRFFYF
jgi:uncharacterized membrane protein YwzB